MAALGAHASKTVAESKEPVTLKGVAVLIVDDETDARELLVAMLGDYRAEGGGGASGAAAIAPLSGDAFRPHVLVSAAGTPGPDGFALLRATGGMPADRLRKLPAIAVTAYANPDDRVRALVAGYQNHIPKPVDANALAAAIAQLIVRPATPS